MPFRQNILLKPLFIFQDEVINAQGPPLLLITHSPSYTYDATWLNFVKIVELPDKDAISISSKIVEGYEFYPRGPESAGVGGILNICTCH